MLTWTTVIALAIGVYAQRAIGALLVDADRIGTRTRSVLDALPLAIISAVVALSTFADAGSIDVDPKVAGLAAAGICAWRRLPMFVTVIVAAAVTALIRSMGYQ